MLMLKLQYFGHLMGRADSLEKILMLGKIEDKRRREQQWMRWLDSINDSMNMRLSKLREMAKPGILQFMGSQRLDMTEWLNKSKFRKLLRSCKWWIPVLVGPTQENKNKNQNNEKSIVFIQHLSLEMTFTLQTLLHIVSFWKGGFGGADVLIFKDDYQQSTLCVFLTWKSWENLLGQCICFLVSDHPPDLVSSDSGMGEE